jgi:sugar phosphate isomerase/epimerase
MIRFGPAGYPEGAKGGESAVELVRKKGLDAMELQFGRQVNLSDERADAIRRKAEELDVRLSAHAPYYISFNSVPETYEKSKEWVMRTARVASKAGCLDHRDPRRHLRRQGPGDRHRGGHAGPVRVPGPDARRRAWTSSSAWRPWAGAAPGAPWRR